MYFNPSIKLLSITNKGIGIVVATYYDLREDSDSIIGEKAS